MESLLDKTKNGKLEWDSLPNDDGWAVRLGSVGVGLVKVSELSYRLIFLNASGEVADGFVVNMGEPEFETVSSLARCADRAVRKTDETLRALSDELDKL